MFYRAPCAKMQGRDQEGKCKGLWEYRIKVNLADLQLSYIGIVYNV